jgi:hypothetical protein
MKTMAGDCLRASLKSRRMRAAPRPANISTNDDADCAKNFAFASFATALARRVLPVPGGPWSRMPFGTRAPSFLKRLGSRKNSTTSRSSSFASSAPATSAHRTELDESGLISCGLVRGTRESVTTTSTTIVNMKITGSQVSTQPSTDSQVKARRRSTTSPIGRGAAELYVRWPGLPAPSRRSRRIPGSSRRRRSRAWAPNPCRYGGAPRAGPRCG